MTGLDYIMRLGKLSNDVHFQEVDDADDADDAEEGAGQFARL